MTVLSWALAAMIVAGAFGTIGVLFLIALAVVQEFRK